MDQAPPALNGFTTHAMSEPSIAVPPVVRAAPPAWRRLGAGVITGAADDDPSGIATYSQVGAQFGYSMLWTTVATVPLMIAIQTICAHVARVTGVGLATNLAAVLPRALVFGLIGLLVINNVVNLAADIGAMGDAVALLAGGHARYFALLCATVSLVLEISIPFRHYAPILKVLTLSLFAYVLTACVVGIPWMEIAHHWLPEHVDHEMLIAVVAVFGTSVSPYLFFWQAAEEVEEERADPTALPLLVAPEQATAEFHRIGVDTDLGMTYSNAVAFFIILTAAVVLHGAGVTSIETSADAARALQPLAGRFASVLFTLGIVGTGMLAVPVLAGSAAYALTEVLGKEGGLERPLSQARTFYGVLAVATVLGTLLTFLPISPLRLLFWSAVINGVIAVPLMAGIMWVACSGRLMGPFALTGWLRGLGWGATAVMGLVALGLLW
jgi:Mn2+/Fe2+ NRAMP family transporter